MVDDEGASAAEALGTVPAWFEAWEARLSRFRPTSELSRLNRRRGPWTRVSPTLWTVARHALWAARATRGLVLPTLHDDLVRTGYDRPYDELRRASSLPPPAPPMAPRRRDSLRLLRRDRLLYVPREGGIDLAGVAKAWAASEAARRLGRFGPALVDAGGDVAVTAPPYGSPGWPIAVEATHDEWLITSGGIATCGRDYRRWRQGATERHHIIDPRTGEPAATDVLTATVSAPTLLEADVSARAALILGSADGAAWLAARPRLTWVLAREDGTTVSGGRPRPESASPNRQTS